MKPFRLPDLIWLEPIAKQYGEWEDMLNGLQHARAAVVEPKHCILVIFEDAHGLCMAGVTNPEGIKKFIRMGEDILTLVDDENLTLHGHHEPGSWQARVAVRGGFIRQGDSNLYIRPSRWKRSAA